MAESVRIGGLFVLGAALCAQEMPYPVAYTYVAMAESGDGWSVTATSVANTNCTSGHTLPVVAVTVYNPGRTRSASASGEFSPYCFGQATAYLPLCSGGVCEDGLFEADNEGTTEYCPIALAFLAALAASQQEHIQHYIWVDSAWWAPSGPIATQKGSSTFKVRARQSRGCGATAVSISANFDPEPDSIQWSKEPLVESQGCQPNLDCAVEWRVTTSPLNESTGTINGAGILESYTGPNNCTVKDHVKSATIEVKQDTPPPPPKK